MQKERKLISIVVPVYNEEGNIEPLFDGIKSAVSKLSDYYFEIIFIDDGSTDKTREKIQNLPDNEQFAINYQRTKRNSGKTKALKKGFAISKGEMILTMDGDLQDDPKYIPDYIERLKNENLDMVVGNRSNRYSKNALKWFSSHVANKIAAILSGTSVSDMNCGYKIMTSECAKTMVLKSDYHRYLPLLAGIEGFLVGEIEITQNKRHSGDSKYGKTGLGRFMVSALDMISIYFIYKFRKEPFRIFGRIGFILILAGSVILGYLSILWFGGQYIRSRPMFFLGILLMIIGTNVLGMGLLG
jgi:glycosyltransferase involved in cell wall biosynthesis